MKIGIIGAGAMGSLYGAKLSALSENEVYLVDISRTQIDAVNEKGLVIERDGEAMGYHRLSGVFDAADAGICELVIVFVKSTATGEAVQRNLALFGPETIALTLQNGLGNGEAIREVLGEGNRVLAGTTAHGATMLSPGRIRHAGVGKTILGEMGRPESELARTLAALFCRAGLETQVSDNVEGLIWDKLLVNAGINALTGLTGLCNGQLLEYPDLNSILSDAVLEGERVALKKGVHLQFTDPVAHTRAVCEATAQNCSSMLQDLQAHRLTEIDTINGAIAKEGKRLGIPTPVNETLTRLIRYRQSL